MMVEQQDEDVTARLLRLAGERPTVPPDRETRIRDAVRAEWEGVLARRARRRRAFTAASALAAAAGIALAITWRPDRAAVEPVVHSGSGATVDRVDGTWRLGIGDRVSVGEWLETGTNTRVALRLTDRSSLRLDADTRMRLSSLSVIELAGGALYVDTAEGSTGVEVHTPFGIARDIGTQFEVRVGPSAMRLRVRSGLVEVRRGATSTSARPGMEITLGAGEPVTTTIPVAGGDWQWAASLAPPFDIEGRSLAAFLDHVVREQGWTVRYGDARLAREASAIILHGSVTGLAPRDAIAVALRTSGLGYRVEDDELVVFRE